MLDAEPDGNKMKDSFQRVYTQYYNPLVNFAESYVARRDVAEDIVQDVFAGLWGKEVCFLSLSALSAYLYTSVKNASLDFLKHQEVEHRYVERYLSDSEEKRWEARLDEEVMNLLFRSIDSLPKRCREIFLMHLDGLSNKEIASALGLSVLTVKSQKKWAMKALREYFHRTKDKKSVFFLTFLFLAYPL